MEKEKTKQGENCRICELLRKGERARIENEKHAAIIQRQKIEPIDYSENLIGIGDTIKFLTLYGYRMAIVRSIINEPGKGFAFRFDPMQIGPNQAFKPVSQWHLSYGMQSVTKVI